MMASLDIQSIVRVTTVLRVWIIFSCCFSQFPLVKSKVETNSASSTEWDHILDVNNDFRLLWTIMNDDVMFEVQVRTHGYVGFGFSTTGTQEGADVAIGWVHKGQTFFQDRHVPANTTSIDPLVDSSQDYILLMGHENETHTILRFSRKLDTCDSVNDIPITNDTMRLMFLYDDNDPPNPESLPNLRNAWRDSRSLVLTERPLSPHVSNFEKTRILEFRNSAVELPYDGTLIWCKFFKLDQLDRKNHIVKFEPIFDSSWSLNYLQYITLNKCTGSGPELEALAHAPGHQCHNIRNSHILCNTYIAAWSRGSVAFTYPTEVGYPLDSNDLHFIMMETHYTSINADFEQLQIAHIFDSSGLRLHITEQLRLNDAGLMSLGIESNWHHIIPPGQKRVVSQGHCVEQCTDFAFPSEGINIFATMMRTHQIGVEGKLRQIRNRRELAPIVLDSNIDPTYQTFRRLAHSVRSLPGDRLVAECVYDSSSRNAITLGGPSMKEESCMIFVLYYPRQQALTSCHSSPSLATVLHSLGIEYLNANSDPVVISLPSELKGMTLETRLLTYDWENQFQAFQGITLNGSFKSICQSEKTYTAKLSHRSTGWPVNLTQTFVRPNSCTKKRPSRIKIQQNDANVVNDISDNDIVEQSVRNSRSSFSETLALSGLESSSTSHGLRLSSNCFVLILIVYAFVLS